MFPVHHDSRLHFNLKLFDKGIIWSPSYSLTVTVDDLLKHRFDQCAVSFLHPRARRSFEKPLSTAHHSHHSVDHDDKLVWEDRKSTTSELQSRFDLVCRLLLEKKNERR